MLNTKSTNTCSYGFLDCEAGAPVTDKHFETIRLLTQNKEENINKFREVLKRYSGFTSLAISEYRRGLRKQDRGCVSGIEIIESCNKHNTQKLKQLLSELFLEYIFDWEIDLMYEKIGEGKITIEKLYYDYMGILERGETCRFGYLVIR